MFKIALPAIALYFVATCFAAAALPTQTSNDEAVTSGQNILFDFKQEAKRKKPRVPGGSGCDSANDILEHPECRG